MLVRAVDSVLAQTFKDFELLIVDDGSTDETPQVVDGFVDHRIRSFRHCRNRGPAAARNTGIANARGEYVAFLDDDDEFLPRKIEEQVRALDAAGPEVGMVYVWCFRVSPTGEIVGTRCREFEGDVHDLALMLRLVLSIGSSSMIPTPVFGAVGCFNERLQICEDLDFLCRLSERFEIKVIPQYLARLHTGHTRLSVVTRKSSTARRDYTLWHISEYADALSDRGRVRSLLWRRLAATELEISNYRGALRAVTFAFFADPKTAYTAAKWLVGMCFGRLRRRRVP